MGNAADKIYMDYKLMREKARQLDELAERVQELARDEVGSHLSNRGAWTGDSGDAARQKLMKMEKNLEKRAKDLHNTANALRSAAERHYKLEMALIALVSR